MALKKVADANRDPNDEDEDDMMEDAPLPEPEPEVATIFTKKSVSQLMFSICYIV